mmetsp:Transcript_141549/g.271757  ORF Transcript_141549/g.271757 Transcript_141549/m.271757 type:complete len:853 (+) Transcript_141549:123-2681(+)
MNPWLQNRPRGPDLGSPWGETGPSNANMGYGFLAPSVGYEFESLHSQLAKQEAKAAELKWQSIEKLRQELEREEDAANNIRYRMHVESMNGVAAMYPGAVNPALLRPPGAFRPAMPILAPQPGPPMGPPQWRPPQQPQGPYAPYPRPDAVLRPMMRPPGPTNPFLRPPNGAWPPGQMPSQDLAFQAGATPSMGSSMGSAAAGPPGQEEVEEMNELSPDDPETRHEAVKERCTWLYLKGRLEGFEILRPELVFEGDAPPRVQLQLGDGRSGGNAADVPGVLADVSAFTQGFTVMQMIPHAEIVHNVNYALSGRDDHPGQASNLVFAFHLRARPALDGNHLLEVMAPRGFEFRERCEMVIGADVFGLGQPYPTPYVPFTPGVRHYARIVLSPGVVEGQRYAFRLRVDQQPQVTPIPNEWRLSFGSEAGNAHLPSPPSSSEGGEVRIEEEMASPAVAEPCAEESPAATAQDVSEATAAPEVVAADVDAESESPEGGDADKDDDAESVSVTATVVDMDSLPSVGSALHGTGECKRCNFFPKGRCQNGKDCTFCHFPHDKRKPSRQEKRERRAAWLEQQLSQGGNQELPTDLLTPKDSQSEDAQSVSEQSHKMSAAAQLGLQHEAADMHIAQAPAGFHMGAMLPQSQLPVFQDEDAYNDDSQQTLAYSLFPGVPPIQATKLPGPLPLPVTGTTCMDFVSTSAPSLPPGLAPPHWQPEAEASPAAQTLIHRACHMATMPAYFDHHVQSLQQVISHAEPWCGGAPLATVPSPTATAAPAVTMCTTATQTADDAMCHRCEDDSLAAEDAVAKAAKASKNIKAKSGCQWSREDMLRVRSGLLEAGVMGTVLFRTAPITSSS